MNLDDAIEKHAAWKVKFRAAINKKETLDAATIKKDHCCDLGKWLHGEGKSQVGSRASFITLLGKHAEFHRAAGKVADTINAKQYDAAENMLGAGTEYSQASAAVAAAISLLKKEM
ncbi:MAG: CZB domain-containing protein [Burkholderiales bacterium]|nr:CZB domain-containing protein [Burkholderiales bacterium]